MPSKNPPRRKRPQGQLPLLLREVAEKPKRLGARRRRARLFSIVFIVLLLVSAGVGLSWLSYLDALAVSGVSVSGTETLSQSQVALAAEASLFDGENEFFSRTNMFLYPSGKIAADVQTEFPRIAAVSVARDSLFGRTVEVMVSERKASHRWCALGEACYLMDASGFIFAPAEGSPLGYTFSGGLLPQDPIGQYFLRAHLDQLLAFLETLAGTGIVAERVVVENETDFSVYVREGFPIKLLFATDPAKTASAITLTLESEALKDRWSQIQYVDARFGNRVYYKLRGE